MSVRQLRDLGRAIAGPAPATAREGMGPDEATERLAAAASSEGLLDVAYGFTDSPFGPLLVAMTGRGLVRLAYPNERAEDVLTDLGRRISPRVLESKRATDAVRRELDEYFDGRRTGFGLKVDLAMAAGPFTRRILEAAERIPYGHVMTYRAIAAVAGSPRGARAAGNALGSNPIPIVVPCHRVVHSGGGLGGYTGGLDRKVTLLSLEGVLRDGATKVAPSAGGGASPS